MSPVENFSKNVYCPACLWLRDDKTKELRGAQKGKALLCRVFHVAWEIWALFWQMYFNYPLLFTGQFRVALPLPSSPTTSPGSSLPKWSDLFKPCDVLEIIHAGSMQFIFWVLSPLGDVSPAWFWVLKIQGRGFVSFQHIYHMAENVNRRKSPGIKGLQFNHKLPWARKKSGKK